MWNNLNAMLSAHSVGSASGNGDAMVQALVTSAVTLGGEPWALEASVHKVVASCGGDVELLVAAKDHLVEAMIAGAAPHDAKTGVFILRCAALQAMRDRFV